MPFRDYTELVPPMEFPIHGKTYRTYGPGVREAEQLNAIVAGEDTSLQGEPPETLWRLLLGPVWDEMAADGVDYAAATRVALTVLTHFSYGSGAAEMMWEKGADPAALARYLGGDAATIAATPAPEGAADAPPAASTGHVAEVAAAVDRVTAAAASAAAVGETAPAA